MAVQPKKFGALAGVFTPSILTILGVIMYMRLGWVTANSGLIQTLAIILLAHVISITTGLSISSIATDKKIRTGGIYYILSRSLGLPIGGSIGVTMFIGTALSISLYLIGFAENFLGIEAIRNLTGLGETINDYRIVGTVAILMLLGITLISTSVAIKTQFFILGAIVLSLMSIALGFFLDGTTDTGFALRPADGHLPFEVAFAIFFPAVTGFTAGVAMSGDLKDPRKDIPLGTMLSISVGLVTYILLAIGFAFFADREMMLTDKNFLMKIAIFAPLVIAGIWGATLSSAIGGLLGGPRILQAMSSDRITPRFFGKGYGVNNEPRNALLMTFLIAEGGILIGELDVIAAIVSMFYIAAYGFINLAFALENWASTDFRPGFRISKWVGIAGFIASFLVMFKIDSTAMLAAIILLWAIYYFVKRKKLELDFGDVWQSVWSSIVRSTLNNITKKGLEERNWRPNIILFSGGGSNRPHLVQFGKDLVERQGLLSNFDLILNRSAKVLLKKHQQSVTNEETAEHEGIFTRRQECKDIYEGIETIASTYGFSGVEPNMILMGWARQSQDPMRFAQMVKTLSALDLNIVMMDYDQERGFGSYEKIDVWCRGQGNNCTFVLSLARFLWSSENWKNAQVRILLINPVNEDKDQLYKDTHNILEKQRINAEVKIINNQIEQRSVYEIMQIESSSADLVFLGISEVMDGQEFKYVEDVNHLCQNIGTVALVKASSYFTGFTVGKSKEPLGKDKSKVAAEQGTEAIIRKVKTPEIRYPGQPDLAEKLGELHQYFQHDIDGLRNCFTDLFSFHPKVIEDISEITERQFQQISSQLAENRNIAEIVDEEFIRKYLNEVNNVLKLHREGLLADQKEILSPFVKEYIRNVSNINSKQPNYLVKHIGRDDLAIRGEDPVPVKIFKLYYRAANIIKGGPVRYKVRYRKLLDHYIPYRLNEATYEVLRNWGLISLQFTVKLQKNINAAVEAMLFMYEKERKGEMDPGLFEKEKDQSMQMFRRLLELNTASLTALNGLILNKFTYIFQQICNDVIFIQSNRRIQAPAPARKQEKQRKSILSVAELWKSNQYLHFESIFFSNQVMICQSFLRKKLDAIYNYYDDLLNTEFRAELDKLFNSINRDEWKDIQGEILVSKMQGEEGLITTAEANLLEVFEEMPEEAKKDMAETYHIFNRSKIEDFKNAQFYEETRMIVPAASVVEHIVENEFSRPLADQLNDSLEAVRNIMTEIGPVLEFHAGMKDSPEEEEPSPEETETAKNKHLESLNGLITQHEKAVMRFENKVKERMTALSDKFTFNSIISYYLLNKRKIK